MMSATQTHSQAGRPRPVAGLSSSQSGRAAKHPKPGLRQGLSTLGTGGDSSISSMLSRPLADYYLILVSATLLSGLGVLMVLSSSSVWSAKNNGDAYYYLLKQLCFLAIGVPAAWWLSRRSSSFYMVFGWVGLIVSIMLLILIFTPLGVDVYGNRAWLKIPGLGTIQPSEFAKISLVLWSSSVFANRTKTLSNPKRLFFPFLLGYGVVIGLVLLQKDLGTAVILVAIMFSMLWFVGVPIRVMGLLGLGCGVVLAAMVVSDPERMHRIFSFLNKTEIGSDQPTNALYALASGGWWGVGLGHSRQKWGGLYNGAQTDYVLAVLGEEMGLFGTLIVLALFMVLIFAGLRIAARSSKRFLSYAAAGMTAWLSIQAIINIFVVMRMLMVVGVPLPFLSQGGSALLAVLLAVGVLLGAARKEPEAAAFLAESKKTKRPKMTSVVDSH